MPLDGRLRKREFREFMNAVFDAMPSAASAESRDALLGSLRSHVTVSHHASCLVVYCARLSPVSTTRVDGPS